MPVRPKKLQGVAADAFETKQFKATRTDLLDGTEDAPEGIRFALARGAGAGAAEHVEGQVEFLAIREAEREFGADHGGVFEAHHAG
jgi:hypothetical protein